MTEIVYAYASTMVDNSSAFAGLSANTPWYNVTTGLTMFFGRFAHAIPIRSIAGSFAATKKAKPSAAPFRPMTRPSCRRSCSVRVAKQLLGGEGVTF